MIRGRKISPNTWLTVQICAHIFELFKKEIEFDEPIPDFSNRPKGALEGILNSVKQTFDRKYLNPTIINASAAYFNQLVRGHPFLNGNKRLAVLFTHTFLLLNGYDLKLNFKSMYNLALLVAKYSEKGVAYETTKTGCIKIFRKYLEKL